MDEIGVAYFPPREGVKRYSECSGRTVRVSPELYNSKSGFVSEKMFMIWFAVICCSSRFLRESAMWGIADTRLDAHAVKKSLSKHDLGLSTISLVHVLGTYSGNR